MNWWKSNQRRIIEEFFTTNYTNKHEHKILRVCPMFFVKQIFDFFCNLFCLTVDFSFYALRFSSAISLVK
jgi:hypothetical protein